MAENMQFNIVVETKDSKGNVTTLTQDLNNLRKAIELAQKTGEKITIKGPDTDILKAGTYSIDEMRLAASRLAKEIGTLRQAGNEVKSFSEQLKDLNRIREQLSQSKDPMSTMQYSRIKGGAEVGINLEQSIKLIDMVESKRSASSAKLSKNIEKQRIEEEKAAEQHRRSEFRKQELIQATINKIELYNLKLREGKFATESSLKAEQQALQTRMRRLGSVTGEDPSKIIPSMPEFKSFGEYQAGLPKQEAGPRSFRQLLADQQALAEQIILNRNAGKISADEADKSLSGVKKRTQELRTSMKEVQNVMGEMGTGLDKLGGFGIKLKSHFYWIAAGQMINAISAMPNFIKNITVELDGLNRKIYQNLELADQYRADHGKLEADMSAINTQAGRLSLAYGVSMKNTMNMMQIMSRRFKDKNELLYYTNLAMVLHKLDFVEPAKAAETLEAVVLSLGLSYKEAEVFVNQFSVATHSARVTGTALLDALQRAAPILKQYNMGTRESIALVSTLSTYSGREGAYIGNAITGMFAKLNAPQTRKALESWGISFFKGTGEAKKGFEVILELSEKVSTLTDKAKAELTQSMFGAHRMAIGAVMLEGGVASEKDLDFLSDLARNYKALGEASNELTMTLLAPQLGSYQTKIDKFNVSLEIMAKVVGEKVVPKLTDMAVGLTVFTGYLGDSGKELSTFTSFALTAIEVFGVWKIATMLANIELIGMGGSLATLAAKGIAAKGATLSLGASIAAGASGIAAAAWPITIVIGTIIALMAVAKKAYAMFKEYKETQSLESYIAETEADPEKKARSLSLTEAKKALAQQKDLDAKKGELYKARAEEIARRDGEYNEQLENMVGRDSESNWQLQQNQEEQTRVQQQESDKRMGLLEKETDAAQKSADKAREAALSRIETEKLIGDNRSLIEEMMKKARETATGTPPPPSTKGGGGAGAMEREAEKGARLALRIRLSDLNAKIKDTERAYQENLDAITHKEDIYGKTIETTMNKIAVYQARKNQLMDEENKLLDARKELESVLAVYEEQASEILSTQVDWGKLSLSQKAGRLQELKSENSQSKSILFVIEEMMKVDEKRGSLAKDRRKIEADILKMYERKPEQIIKDEIDRLETRKQIAMLEKQDKTSPFAKQIESDVRLGYERQIMAERYKLVKKGQSDLLEIETEIGKLRIQMAELVAKGGSKADKDALSEKIKGAEEQHRQTSAALDKDTLAHKQAKKTVEDLEKEKSQAIKSGLAGIIDDIVVQGTSLKDIWKKLWNQLASDAIKALLGVENQSAGLLSKLMGLGQGVSGGKKGGTGKKGAQTSSWMTSVGTLANKPLPAIPTFHDGGSVGTQVNPYIKSDEVNAVLQTGEEVVSRKDRRSNELMTSQNKYLADAMERVAMNSNQNYTFMVQAVDAKSVAELFKQNADSFIGILRQQQAYGNSV